MIIEPYTWHTTEIIDIIGVAHDTIAIRVKRPAGYAFQAGQYAIVRVYITPQKFLVRQYSFSSPPSADWLEFTIQREPGGEVTTWLHENAAVGTKIEVSQSFGHFTFENSDRPKLFIAGRVGIAPFMSYIRNYKQTKLHVIYSVRSPQETCYWDELKPITTRIITAERPRINGELLQPFIEDRPIVYICGSRQFAEAMQAHLMTLLVPAHDIRRELFTL